MIKMFPSKSMVDYMSEMNRLFSRPDNDILQSNAYGLAMQSPFNSTNNRSSSSADSTSPESFPEITTFRPEFSRPIPEQRSMYEPPPRFEEPRFYDTPKPNSPFMRRQRPIVGRKIFASDASTPKFERFEVPVPKTLHDYEMPSALWQEESGFQQTPPKVNNYFIKHNSFLHNYELFPTENKGPELTSPVKMSPSSTISNASPPMFNASPISRSPSATALVPYRRSPSVQSLPFSGKYSQDISQSKMCTFCRKNGETPIVFMTHCVKEKIGNKYVVTCPILRSHVCSTCGATGDDAHTITYCPVLRSGNNGQPLQSTTITLKNTRIKSNGRRRY